VHAVRGHGDRRVQPDRAAPADDRGRDAEHRGRLVLTVVAVGVSSGVPAL
jgi:hypothetical protein